MKEINSWIWIPQNVIESEYHLQNQLYKRASLSSLMALSQIYLNCFYNSRVQTIIFIILFYLFVVTVSFTPLIWFCLNSSAKSLNASWVLYTQDLTQQVWLLAFRKPAWKAEPWPAPGSLDDEKVPTIPKTAEGFTMFLKTYDGLW